MAWHSYVTPAELRHVNDPDNHGDATFRKIARSVLLTTCFHGVKATLAPQQHEAFETGWRQAAQPGSWMHKTREDVLTKVDDLMSDLDNRTGGHGHRGTAWIDARVADAQAFVRRKFH